MKIEILLQRIISFESCDDRLDFADAVMTATDDKRFDADIRHN